MKKTLSLITAAIIVGMGITCICYLGGLIFKCDYLLDWTNDITFGLSGALAGLLSPIIVAAISKKKN